MGWFGVVRIWASAVALGGGGTGRGGTWGLGWGVMSYWATWAFKQPGPLRQVDRCQTKHANSRRKWVQKGSNLVLGLTTVAFEAAVCVAFPPNDRQEPSLHEKRDWEPVLGSK